MPGTRPMVPAKLTVDFSNVEERREGGKSAHVPEGDYLLKVAGCELKSKKDDATSKYLNWRLTITSPEQFKNAGSIWHITSLKPEALWNLRNFLEDLGVKVPKGTAEIPIKAIVDKGLIIGATLEDDEYNNVMKSKIAATFKKDAFKASDEEADDEEEEETSTEASDEDDVEEIDVDDL